MVCVTRRWRRESAANSSLETRIFYSKEGVWGDSGISERRFGLDLAHIVSLYPTAKSKAYEFLHPARARVRA
jgi:hypothetical protein